MTVGYPDYARLTEQGGYELLSVSNAAPAYFTKLFQGYVGSWPYLNIFTNMASSSDFADLHYVWTTDGTFNTIAGFTDAVRTGGSIAATQYANLTDWFTLWYTTKSGSPMTFQQWSIYGTTAPADQFNLTTMVSPMLGEIMSVPASSSGTIGITPIQPGRTTFCMQTVAVSWDINIQIYNFNTGTYQTIRQFNSSHWVNDIQADIPMLDAPYQVQIQNNDTSARNFVLLWNAS